MNRKKIVYVISEAHSVASFEWLAESFLARDMQFIFVLMNASETQLEKRLKALGQEVRLIHYSSKRDLPTAIFQLSKIFRELRPNYVHTHLLAANLAGLFAAWIMGVPQRIYTHHHGNTNQIGPWHAKFYDWLPNKLATKVVATCDNVKNLLIKEGVPERKILMVRFGFPEKFAQNISSERITTLRKKYRLEGHRPVIGVISRYVAYKGVPFIIQAFQRLLQQYPEACLFLANAGNGSDAAKIRTMLNALPVDSYREVPFEPDSLALFRCFDIFVHTPLDLESEAFGQVYIESMLAGVPSIFTLSGVAPEIVRHGKNALVVPYANADAISQSLLQIMADADLAKNLAERAAHDASRQFTLEKNLQELEAVYT